jgi:hypothetical protein
MIYALIFWDCRCRDSDEYDASNGETFASGIAALLDGPNQHPLAESNAHRTSARDECQWDLANDVGDGGISQLRKHYDVSPRNLLSFKLTQ